MPNNNTRVLTAPLAIVRVGGVAVGKMNCCYRDWETAERKNMKCKRHKTNIPQGIAC